jgi:hypothetical protein
MLLNSSALLIDSVTFGIQQADKAYARVPNGSGPFVIQDATHAANNSPNAIEESSASLMRVYPNPASDAWYIHFPVDGDHRFVLYDAGGRELLQGTARGSEMRLDAGNLSPGVYFLRETGGAVRRLIRSH